MYKLGKLKLSHNLRFIISSKDIKDLGQEKEKSQYWMVVIFVSSGGHCTVNRSDTVLDITARAQEHLHQTLTHFNVPSTNAGKALSSIDEALCEHYLETLPSSPDHLK